MIYILWLFIIGLAGLSLYLFAECRRKTEDNSAMETELESLTARLHAAHDINAMLRRTLRTPHHD